MDREVIDLGVARKDEVKMIHEWEYLYVGDCNGDVLIKFGSKSASPLHPEEFDKVTDIKHMHYMYLTNAAQPDKTLVIYFKTKKKRLFGWI